MWFQETAFHTSEEFCMLGISTSAVLNCGEKGGPGGEGGGGVESQWN
jgi:hypothetical protein